MSLLDSHWKRGFKVGSWVAYQVLAFIAIALTLGTHLLPSAAASDSPRIGYLTMHSAAVQMEEKGTLPFISGRRGWPRVTSRRNWNSCGATRKKSCPAVQRNSSGNWRSRRGVRYSIDHRDDRGRTMKKGSVPLTFSFPLRFPLRFPFTFPLYVSEPCLTLIKFETFLQPFDER
jgi:hypothetical protein